MEPLKKCIFIGILSIMTIVSNAQAEVVTDIADSVMNEIMPPVKKHYPRKATIYSAVLPGLGQIYNHQWWKVPFIYGGFGFIAYEVNDLKKVSREYYQAYYDLNDGDPTTVSYESIFETALDENNASTQKTQLTDAIAKIGRTRSLYLIGAAGFFLFNILDANVNAHFLDFDISEDLSLNLSPIMIEPMTQRPVPGMTLVFNF